MTSNPEKCVHEVLDVIPMVMRSLRAEFRSHRRKDLNIPQFRTLMFLRRVPGAALSDVADHLGITPPSASTLIDGLVERRLVDRQESAVDRRRVTLALTEAGAGLAETSFRETQAVYVEYFSSFPQETLDIITQAMKALRPIFSEDAQPNRRPVPIAKE
jgi:DNA-binding MarR family transcriptional regulator